MPSITDIEGITVGHWTDEVALTGCTVVLPPAGTIASCEVRGARPGRAARTSCSPARSSKSRTRSSSTGGSAFGLASAGGVERYFEERGIGSEIGPVRVPTVPAAVIFDLGVGDPSRRPGADEGYAACIAASADVAEGRIGVGTGATVAKLWGPERAVPGGVGTWAVRDGELVVGALVVVNAVGEIVDEDGSILVGPRLEPGERREDLVEQLGSSAAANTTLGVVATNAVLSKEDVRRLASIGNDAFDIAIRPAHTIYDGDTVFALATQQVDASFEQVAASVEAAVTTAIRRAVTRDDGSRAAGA